MDGYEEFDELADLVLEQISAMEGRLIDLVSRSLYGLYCVLDEHSLSGPAPVEAACRELAHRITDDSDWGHLHAISRVSLGIDSFVAELDRQPPNASGLPRFDRAQLEQQA